MALHRLEFHIVRASCQGLALRCRVHVAKSVLETLDMVHRLQFLRKRMPHGTGRWSKHGVGFNGSMACPSAGPYIFILRQCPDPKSGGLF